MRSSASSRNYPVYSACILIGAFTLYTLLSSQIMVGLLQYPLILGVLALAYLYYRSLGDGEASSTSGATVGVLSLYSITAIVAFHPTIHTIFRSDDWIILSLFNSIEGITLASAKDIALFEMFGDVRFQPMAHFLLFARYLLFGNNILLHHLLNMALHVLTGLLIFLLLSSLTKNLKLSFILGLLFITLPSQFDAIVWTYHIYIIVSTLFVFLLMYLALKYAESPKRLLLFTALLLALVSMLLYEPAILAPASLLLIISGLYLSGDSGLTRRDLLLPLCSVIVVYAFYLGLTVYGLSLTRQDHFASLSLSELATPGNMVKALMVTFTNLWESTFLKNIGITPNVIITNIIYVATPTGLYTGLAPLGKIALGLFILSLFRPGHSNRHIAIALGGLALSYIYIISLGRVPGNPATYVPSQPRYQYFPNALLLTTAGMLLWRKFQDKGLRPLISALLFAILFWNLLNVVYANNMVGKASAPLDYHYSNIKEFLKSNPSAKLQLSLTPGADWKFYLGSDIAFDLLFKERLTKFQQKATHIYDGETFSVNRSYGTDAVGEDLGNFTVEWVYHRGGKTVQANPVRIIGPGKTYPKISIIAGERVRVDMVVSGGSEIHSFSLAYPPWSPDNTEAVHITHMIVEKDDNVLCLAYNGILVDKIALNTAYRQWNGDGLGLYGEYFRGSGEPVLIMDTQLFTDIARRGCKDKQRGEILAPELLSIKKKTAKPL